MFTKRWLICGLTVVLFLSLSASYRKVEAAPPIKIGYLTPLTGPFARIGSDLRDGWILHFGEIGNKVEGRDIQLIVEDTEGKPDVGLIKTRKLVEKDNVHMLAGVFSTGVAYAIRDYVHNQKVPWMITNAGADDLTKQKRSPYIFRSSLTGPQLALVLGDWTYKKLGKRKLVIVGQDYPGSWEWCGPMAYSFILAGGKVLQEIYTPMGTTDFAPYITAINREADAVFSFHIGYETIRFSNQYSEFGLYGKIQRITGLGEIDEMIYPQIGDYIVGTIATGIRGYPDNPHFQAFYKDFKGKFGKEPGGFGDSSYMGALFVSKALQEVKGNIEDKEAFLKALRRTKIPESGWGPLSFDEYQHVIRDVPICKLVKVGNTFRIDIIDSVPQMSQFWRYTAEEYIKKFPNWAQMKMKWSEYKPVK